MNTVQLNTRVNPNLRDVGGKSFNNAGFTLSEAIRIYLDFASRNIANPQKIKNLINDLQAGNNDSEKIQKIQEIKKGSTYINDFCKKNNLVYRSNKTLNNMSYKELRNYFYNDGVKTSK